MGIPSEIRDVWVSKRNCFIIASPDEERKLLRSKKCTHEGVIAGFKAASVACVVSAVPTLTAVRKIPWAKANLNYTAQALIISAASIAAYFITADKTILECARKNAQLENSLRHNRDTVSS
ncbi:early nodulin-93-like [Cicer arietinum]|uniref:Early nodulin-93-like n=1 Tax=Cicer arietinum TaxID=3827 RepID=A0A1S2Y2V6_CICAR|nr:early nodulin-93-like [Cicer arietinum]